MKDLLKFKGHFKIKAIDANNNVIDEWEEDNLIMEGARTSMSEIFANLGSDKFMNKFSLGTLGHVSGSEITPKTANEGFVKERDRMFSESVDAIDGTFITVLMNSVIKYTGTANVTGTTNNYYQNTSGATIASNVNDINFASGWTNLGAVAPYTYPINFTIPGSNADPDGTLATGITEPDSGSEVRVLQSGSSVTFKIKIATTAANTQSGTSSYFTEAALYAAGRIFAMKTFSVKSKDASVLLVVDWTINF